MHLPLLAVAVAGVVATAVASLLVGSVGCSSCGQSLDLSCEVPDGVLNVLHGSLSTGSATRGIIVRHFGELEVRICL